MADWEKRKSNREHSTALLIDSGIGFTSHNSGAHLVIIHKGHHIDFWPGTGLYRTKAGVDGRGIANLLKLLKNERVVSAGGGIQQSRRDINNQGYEEYEKYVSNEEHKS